MNSKGFTLSELLVTVAIISILSSMAIHAFSQYREKAYDSVAKSDAKNMVTAIEEYVNQNNGSYSGLFCSGRTACLTVLPNARLSKGTGVVIIEHGFLNYWLQVCNTKGSESVFLGEVRRTSFNVYGRFGSQVITGGPQMAKSFCETTTL